MNESVAKMKRYDPESIALQFNEGINRHDAAVLSKLMPENHRFIDRDGHITQSKDVMIKAWLEFFKIFPNYKNTFTKVRSEGNLVILVGFAYWSEENDYDPAIWTAKVKDGLVAEWRIYSDNTENRKKFHVNG